MDEGEAKPFDLVTTILLIMVAVLDDATTIAALFAVAIPVVGEITFVVDKVFEFAAWAIIQGTFVMKLHSFGAPGIVNTIGGILEEGGVPDTTITTFIAIQMANHPKLAKVAEVVAVAAVSGGVGELAEAGAASEAVATSAAVEGGETAADAVSMGDLAAEEGSETAGSAGASRRPSEIETGIRPSQAKSPSEASGEEEEGVSEKAFGMPAEPFEEAQEEAGLTGKLPRFEEGKKRASADGKIAPFRTDPRKKGSNDENAGEKLPKAA